MRLSVLTLLFITVTSFADTQVSHTFKDGDPAKAAEVNQNFTDLATAIDKAKVPLAMSLNNIDPYTGSPAAVTLIQCTDMEPLLRNTLQLKLNGGNAEGYVAATQVPVLDRQALADIAQILSELASNPLFKRPYAMRLLSREATSGAVDGVVTNSINSCSRNGWFQQIEASPLSSSAAQD